MHARTTAKISQHYIGDSDSVSWNLINDAIRTEFARRRGHNAHLRTHTVYSAHAIKPACVGMDVYI